MNDRYDWEFEEDWFEFVNGTVSCGVYSYAIDSVGHLSLDCDETYKLYLAMKDYYENE